MCVGNVGLNVVKDDVTGLDATVDEVPEVP
jgi:hypothetical protein